jgi:hypothetical protein
MAGTIEDPGLMVLSLQAIFALITKQESEYEFEVTASYLEVYNEVPSTLNLGWITKRQEGRKWFKRYSSML